MSRDLTTSREIRRKYLEYMDRLEWRQFSFEVIDHYGGECWACGGEDDLQAHHLVYRNVMPWEYGMNEMRCLCRRCHAAVHNVADMAWV